MLFDPKTTASAQRSVSTQTDLDDIEMQLQQELRGMFDVDTQQYLQSYLRLVGQLQATSWTMDIQELFRNVHTIKGGAVTVGADGILYVATVLEDLLGDLRHLTPAPPLADGQLGQWLLEAGELLASSLSVWEMGEAAQKAVQPSVERIHALRAQIQQCYLRDWDDQKRLHQEFAEQGFDLVVLELELSLEKLSQPGSIPDDTLDCARQTLAQLAEIGCDLEFAGGWASLLNASSALLDLQSAQTWRSHWPIYLQALKTSAYAGGAVIAVNLPEVSALDATGNSPTLLQGELTECIGVEDADLLWDFDEFDPVEEGADALNLFNDRALSEVSTPLGNELLDAVSPVTLSTLDDTEEWLDLVSAPMSDSEPAELTLQEPADDRVVRHRTEQVEIQIPVPLGRLDRTAQHLVELLLTARSMQGFHQTLQEQLSQLFNLAQESTQYITRLRQLQNDYALLDTIKTGSDSDSGPLALERYRQGYSTINRLLENSLRLSELGLEAEKKFAQTTDRLHKLERNMVQLQQTIEQSRLVPFAKLAFRARAIVRDLTNRYGKPAQLVVEGEHLDLDTGTLAKLEPVLLHLIRNAYDHGLEPSVERLAQGKSEQGTLILSLQRRGNRFVLDLKDDGRGIDASVIECIAHSQGLPLTQTQTLADLLAVICQPGFSSQSVVTDVSGRGIGMDVVAEQVVSLGGTLTLDTLLGEGTTFRLQFPVPHLLVPCILLQSGDQTFAIPTEDISTTNILANLCVTPVLEPATGYTWHIQGGETLEPALDFLNYWQAGTPSRVLPETTICLSIRTADVSSRIWILADELIGKTDLLIQPLPAPLIAPLGLLGLSLQPDGALIPVLETAAIAECLRQNGLRTEDEYVPDLTAGVAIEPINSNLDTVRSEIQSRSILVVDDAALMRRRLEVSLTAAGYAVITCNDGLEAWHWLQAHPLPALVITDVEMPNMDGFTLINHCRQADINIPILVVSSRLAEEWHKEAQRLGATGYLTKGFSTTQLLDRVRLVMGETQLEGSHL